jgi:glycosidase
MTELTRKLGRIATLDDIPDSDLENFARSGFDWIWFLSVWQTGEEGKRISRENSGWRKEFEETLPDLKEDDIAGSGFAIKSYTVSEQLGGNEALSRLRGRMGEKGLKLMLDFVPNHTGLDHPWINEHTDFYIISGEQELGMEPKNFTRVLKGDVVLAHGRDPYFPGWPDTAQLNYGNPDLQEAMKETLVRIAGQCDGVRCDMAMLVLPEVFERTWGIHCVPFWPDAVRRVKNVNPGFCFVAEVYWDLEWTMLQNGFDYTYDKRLYDRLKEGHAQNVREHFFAGLDYQGKMARFLENHDEPRAASEFSAGKHEAAAILTFLSPGLRFFHQGQFEGRKKRISPHLVRAPEEPVIEELELFYDKLLYILDRPVFKMGHWQLLESSPAWEWNHTNNNFISFLWKGENDEKLIVVVNYSHERSQCYTRVPLEELDARSWLLVDLISGVTYERLGYELKDKGLYLDEPAWKCYVFTLKSEDL